MLRTVVARARVTLQRAADLDEYYNVQHNVLDYGAIMDDILAHGGREKLRQRYPGSARVDDEQRAYCAAVAADNEKIDLGPEEINAMPSTKELYRLLGRERFTRESLTV